MDRRIDRLNALGRKNYLFVGDVDAGMSIAGLYTLVATRGARDRGVVSRSVARITSSSATSTPA